MIADYRKALKQLLPRGPAWDEANAWNLTALLDIFSMAYSQADDTLGRLMGGFNPALTNDGELLNDWERVLGLPECNIKLDISLTARQQRAKDKLTITPNLTRAYILEQLRLYGFNNLTLTQDATNPSNFTLDIKVNSVRIDYFTTLSNVLTPLANYSGSGIIASNIQCLIKKLFPADANVTLNYSTN